MGSAGAGAGVCWEGSGFPRNNTCWVTRDILESLTPPTRLCTRDHAASIRACTSAATSSRSRCSWSNAACAASAAASASSSNSSASFSSSPNGAEAGAAPPRCGRCAAKTSLVSGGARSSSGPTPKNESTALRVAAAVTTAGCVVVTVVAAGTSAGVLAADRAGRLDEDDADADVNVVATGAEAGAGAGAGEVGRPAAHRCLRASRFCCQARSCSANCWSRRAF